MFLLVATALAGTYIGYPCQRLNWAWRNVWSTCSINSYVPHASQATEGPVLAPNQFLRSSDTLLAPYRSLNSLGVFTPVGSASAIPQFLCTNAPATGTGATANLRNRCRRAIDAYGALVQQCGSTILGPRAGPNQLATPDWAPNSGHQPHVSNVGGLTVNAQLCLLPAGARVPADLNTPSTVCPGLLGWFTVVFSACKFTNAPGLATPSLQPGGTPNYFPLGSTAVSPVVLNNAPVSPTNGAGYFCQTGGTAAGSPSKWNDSTGTGSSNTFRTSRCRKALDQFGRTAKRCDASTASLNGPSQAGGYSDPLRLLAVGTTAGGGVVPLGLNSFAPACNA
jgi:hypothetical protein